VGLSRSGRLCPPGISPSSALQQPWTATGPETLSTVSRPDHRAFGAKVHVEAIHAEVPLAACRKPGEGRRLGRGGRRWIWIRRGAETAVTVYEIDPADHWQKLGILGPDGRPIEYYAGPDTLGFLFRDEEDGE
jgi:hypothetical protein